MVQKATRRQTGPFSTAGSEPLGLAGFDASVECQAPNVLAAETFGRLPIRGLSANLAADDLVDRFGLGRGLGEQRVDLRKLLLGEIAILDRLRVDEDIQRAAAQAGIGSEHGDTGIADDVEIALLGRFARQGDNLVAGLACMQRREGCNFQRFLDRAERAAFSASVARAKP